MADRTTNDSPETLPELAADLQRLATESKAPDRIDPEMRRLIRGHFSSDGKRTRRSGWRWRVAALAALVAVSALLIVPGIVRGPGTLTPATLPADLDGDGVVDILDAYHLARHLESGAPHERSHDLNGDGRVDRRDVRSIALEAVRLPEETG